MKSKFLNAFWKVNVMKWRDVKLFSAEAEKRINEEYNSIDDCHGSFGQSNVSSLWLAASIEILNHEGTSSNVQGTTDQAVENILKAEQCWDKRHSNQVWRGQNLKEGEELIDHLFAGIVW